MDKDDINKRMDGAVKALTTEFAGLRTGRAHVSLLEPVNVDAYGSIMHINQVANVSAPEPRLLTVQVWDKGLVKAVEKAIANANLGLNPAADGQTIRVPVPQLSEERRKEMTKVAAKYAENARIAVRNVRRDGMDHLKKEEKDGIISEDEHKKLADEIQKLTDKHVASIDEMLTSKEKDIMTV